VAGSSGTTVARGRRAPTCVAVGRRDSCPLVESEGLDGVPEDGDAVNRPSEARDVGGVSGTSFGTTSSALHRKAVESQCRSPVPSGLPSTRHSIPTTCRLRFRQQAAGGKKAGNLRFASTCQRTTLELVAKTHQDPPEAYRRFERPAGKA